MLPEKNTVQFQSIVSANLAGQEPWQNLHTFTMAAAINPTPAPSPGGKTAGVKRKKQPPLSSSPLFQFQIGKSGVFYFEKS